ncbi:polysaccharide deacetylase family protein [Streptomyces sp. LHD-70]|uniref:polysaccharide deacetylase family protein n=1 Tax=Streptomyces sp. LHD-70 TaxID=3072140 RepID=UPI00280F675F|nr:polysaccharide deacetylase family protein [Streptomyces sp. LHD-70]MDQ8706909.1 polysaccharide deacetylase family protein [Streptomyces sp. LHD-70]
MLYAGISWHAGGYRLAVLGPDGDRALTPIDYAAPHADELIRRLRQLDTPDTPVTVAVESTNGTLDGRLMAAGLRVHRADPWLLPERPLFGSVPAEDLAGASLNAAVGLVPLQAHRGTQTGREEQLADQIAASADADRELTAAGRLFGHGPRDRREVALTFDDGPLPPYTGQILDILEGYGIPATFFCVGINSGGFAEELARMREQGHAIGNHTWSHPFLPELTGPQLAEQIDRTAEAIAEASGGPAPRLFRPPYGARTPEVLGRLSRFDATTLLWDVAPDDWALRRADAIARDVLADVRPGSVVLLHDGGGDRSPTVAALAPIIEGLLEDGYTFVRADTLVDRAATAPVGAP